jgi:hypothetical protein
MPYTAEISRSSPTAFLFLVDQSGSMSDKFSGTEKSKAEQVSDVINRTLMTLITRCTKSEGTRNYFDIGVIGYGNDQAMNGFHGALSASVFNPISEVEANPLRVEDREKKMDDGAGGIITNTVKFPVWFEPKANGGTPMCAALTQAAEALVAWCDTHPDSYPPTIMHITDGESTDGDPEELANQLRQIRTNDGEVLLFNCHISSLNANAIQFPAGEAGLPDSYAKLLFRMSSRLPDHIIKYAQGKGIAVGIEARGFTFNAEAVELVEFLDIGTRASQLR